MKLKCDTCEGFKVGEPGEARAGYCTPFCNALAGILNDLDWRDWPEEPDLARWLGRG